MLLRRNTGIRLEIWLEMKRQSMRVEMVEIDEFLSCSSLCSSLTDSNGFVMAGVLTAVL